MVQSASIVTYVALVLSVCAVTLLIITGITTHREFDKEQRTLSTAHVWHYDHESHVASTHTDVNTVCVGYNDCAASTGHRVLRVNGGIQLGDGPVFRTSQSGRHVVVEDGTGRQILRADLSSGATIVGEGLDLPASGVQVSGYANATDHTAQWFATRGFSLFGDAGHPASRVHSIVHKDDSSIRGVRISPPGPVRGDHAIHITPLGIVVGDAPANFIRENAGKADVLVYGQSIAIPPLDSTAQSCTLPAVAIPNLGGATQTPRVIMVRTRHCNPALLLSIEAIETATCDHKYAFVDNIGVFVLGQCADGASYFCVSPDAANGV